MNDENFQHHITKTVNMVEFNSKFYAPFVSIHDNEVRRHGNRIVYSLEHIWQLTISDPDSLLISSIPVSISYFLAKTEEKQTSFTQKSKDIHIQKI